MKMECITITTELVNCEKRLYNVSKKDYNLDIWRELKRRWMIIGVLVSMTLAVLAPKVGAPGGPLRTEYVSYIPLSCIYYLAGRRATAAPLSLNVRVVAFSAAHAHVVAPVVVAVTGTWLRDAIDFRILKGALLSSVGAPCAWLSLVVARDVGASLVLLAVNYVVSLVAAPIAMFVICGRGPVPAIGPSLWSALCAFPPLTLGVLHSHIKREPCCLKRLQRLNRLAALVLLYVDCCERTSTAGAGLYVGDVLSTLVFAMWCVSASALLCAIYTRVGLSHSQAHTIALCAVPKALHTGWESSINCVPSGLSRLPTVFLAPAQALLLAFLADCDGGECGESCSRKTGENGCLPQ